MYVCVCVCVCVCMYVGVCITPKLGGCSPLPCPLLDSCISSMQILYILYAQEAENGKVCMDIIVCGHDGLSGGMLMYYEAYEDLMYDVHMYSIPGSALLGLYPSAVLHVYPLI